VRETHPLRDRVAVVTGGAGLLGPQHAEALAEAGASVVLLDVRNEAAEAAALDLRGRVEVPVHAVVADVTSPEDLERARDEVLSRFGRLDILVNNAARNPRVEGGGAPLSRLERFPLDQWHEDLAVGLTGAFLCSRAFGPVMAEKGAGVILNVASDLALIAPDQRLYRVDGVVESEQPVKPVSYSVVKAGLLGLTRYLATYWADRGVRVNALCPGGVAAGQDAEFVRRLSSLIPMGRMARRDEYREAVVFLCSDASSYMTGASLVLDGGRTCW